MVGAGSGKDELMLMLARLICADQRPDPARRA